MKRCVLLGLVLLALPGAAQARPFNADERKAVELAQGFWGQAPACALDLQALPYEVVGSYGRAGIHDGVCRLWVAEETMLFDALCTTIIHEWGHLLHGPAHDPHRGAILSEEPDEPAVCSRESDLRSAREARRIYRHRRARCGKRPVKRRACVRRARRALAAELKLA